MQDAVNRRSFLERATVAGGLATLASPAGALEGVNECVVVGVMGLSRGLSVMQTFAKQPNVVVKYVCDVDSKRASAAANASARLGGAAQAIGDFRRILDDKDIDVLVCAAPNHWHAPATILAFEAGKHVYVEKPCSHTPAEGEWMIQAAAKHRRVVQVGTQRRSQPRMIEAIGLINDGAIGRVYHARAIYAADRKSIGRGKPGKPPANLDFAMWQGPAVERPFVDNLAHYNWHWRWHWGNGELGNNGVHTLDLCRWGLGVDFPNRVVSSGGRYCFNDDQETPDTHSVAFEFDGKRSITWECSSCNAQPQGFVTFLGEKGAIAIDGNCGFVVTDLKGKVIRKETAKLDDGLHVANFLSAIRSDKPEITNCGIADGHKAALLCHLGNIAHRTCRVLHCDTANGHIQGDPEAAAMWTKEYNPRWRPNV